MPVVLAIEPGRAQAELLREVHASLGVELLIVSSKDDAIAAIDRQLPDLILVNALLSPREENELVAHLRALENASHLQLLTIPLLARSQAAGEKKGSLFGFGKKKRAVPVADGCDLGSFGEQVATYLARAQEVKSRPRSRGGSPVVKAAPAPAEELAASFEPSMAPPAYEPAETTPIYEPPVPLYDEPAVLRGEAEVVPDVDRLFDELGFAPAEPDPRSAIRDPLSDETQSALRSPHSAVGTPHTAVGTPHTAVGTPHTAVGTPHSAVGTPHTAVGTPHPAVGTPHPADAHAADSHTGVGTPLSDIYDSYLDTPATPAEPLVVLEPPPAAADAQEPEIEIAIADTDWPVVPVEATSDKEAPAADRGSRTADSGSRIAEEDLTRIRAEAEAALAAELDRVRSEAAQQRERELAHWQAEAEALREATVGRARAEAEAKAREALAEELARSRAESEKTRQDELARLQAEADERLEEVTREARQVAETEAARAFAEELVRVRATSEAAAARVLDDEVARVRADADSRLQAELDRVRREAEDARRAEQAAAHAEAERIREAAARDAREIAEKAAARTLEAEIQRVRAEADAVRAAAEAKLAEQTRAHADASHAMAEAERLREAAARDAREAAAREAREVAEATAARKLEAELQRVHADAEARLKEQREAQVKAEKAREAAAREARAVAEAAAARALEAEIRRVKAEADARLAAELDTLRAEAEHRRQLELEQVRQQVEEMRVAAAEQARAAAAEAIAAEVARVAALRGTSPPPKTVPVIRVGAKSSGTAAVQAPAHEPAPAVVPFESKTPSSSYYDLWREEGSPSLTSGETSKSQIPASASRFRREPWMLPAAAAALLVVCGSIGVSVNALGWAASAKNAIASALPSASKPEPTPAAEAPPTGDLLVETTPKGAEVTVDGKARGKTPLTVTGLAPGKHKVELRSSDGVVIQREVLVRVGERAVSSELMVSGWLSVSSRIPVDVLVGGRRVGSSGDGQIMLSPGRHKVTFVNRKFNVRETQTVEVQAGSITPHALKVPSGSLDVDGPEGAEVLVDGTRVGEAPLRGVPVPVGTRDVVIRHPSFGERRQTIDVRYGSPATLNIGAAATPQPGRSFDGLKVLQESAANPARRRPR